MSLKHLAIGLAITLYGLINIKGADGIRLAFWITIIVVGVLWMLEQFGLGSISRPVHKTEV